MRTIKYTNKFRKDFKREKKSDRYRNTLYKELPSIIKLLMEDAILPKNFCDHPLSGEWKDHRDCHVKPDLVLIYRKPDEKILELVRLGSHNALGL